MKHPFGFTGELHAGGLVYLRARWYDGSAGTFTQRDPSGLEPHLYQYARSNPVNFVDPSGLLCMGWMWGWATGDQQCTPVWYASQPGQSWLETTLADPASDLPDQAALFVVGLGHQGAYSTDEHFGTHGTETIARSPNLATNLGKATALAAEILSPLTRLGPATGVTLGALNTSVSARHAYECPSPENTSIFLSDVILTLLAGAGGAGPRMNASTAGVMTMQSTQGVQVASGLATVGTTVRSGALAWMASSSSGGGSIHFRKASEWAQWAQMQGWRKVQSATGPIKYVDENGIVRVTIKRGSTRAPGSNNPHVELRNAQGQRVDPQGNPVKRRSPGNHTPIDWDL